MVTGRTSTIGVATGYRFVEEWAHAHITGRRQTELVDAVKQIGHDVSGVRGRISNLDDMNRLVDAIKDAHAYIDVYFANTRWGDFVLLRKTN